MVTSFSKGCLKMVSYAEQCANYQCLQRIFHNPLLYFQVVYFNSEIESLTFISGSQGILISKVSIMHNNW
jgi:hypothetical protein